MVEGEVFLAEYLIQLIFVVYMIAMVASLTSYVIGEIVTVVASIIGFLASVGVAYIVFAKGIVKPIFGGLLILDPLCAWGLATISIVGLVAAIYSIGYLRNERNHVGSGKLKWYYMLFNATMLAMGLSVVSNNIVLMWAAIEATTLATAFLVGFHETTTSVEAAWKYVIICGVGVGFALFGTVLIYAAGVAGGIAAEEAMLWSGLISNYASLAKSGMIFLLKLGLLLVVFGYMAKAGLFPLHVWLPDAHAEAPSPISAILSGVIVKCALIGILRYYTVANALGLHEYIANVLFVTGVVSMIIGGLCVYAQKDIKRLFAYSTIDQVGVIATAAGVGTSLGILAALMHILYHALAKALAFLGSGLVMIFSKGKRDIDEIGGLLRARLTFTATIITLAILGIIAIPPGPSFFSKMYLFFAAAGKSMLAAVIVLIGMLIAESALIYKMIVIVYGGTNRRTVRETYNETGLWSCKIACILLVAMLVILFVLVQPYISLAEIVAKEITLSNPYFSSLSLG